VQALNFGPEAVLKGDIAMPGQQLRVQATKLVAAPQQATVTAPGLACPSSMAAQLAGLAGLAVLGALAWRALQQVGACLLGVARRAASTHTHASLQ
jgi:hypothetical protein